MNAHRLDATVVVPNYNGRRFLEACLRALTEQAHQPAEIILVDNGSEDESVAFMGAHFPTVRLIQQGMNTGFAAAVNAGIRASRCPIIVTLNNDAIAEPGWLDWLLAPFATDQRIGMVASKMLFVKPHGIINSAGICIDRLGIAWDRLGGEPDTNDERVVDVFGACAGAAAYRRTLLDDIGLFDEDFFAYLEDADLAWRAQLAGWRAVYAPMARVTHWHSATSVEGSPFKSHLLGRNKVWLIAKNYPQPQLWHYLPLIVAYDAAAVLYALLKYRDLHALRGRIEGLRNLRCALAKRKRVQATRCVPAESVVARLEPVVSPRTVTRRYAHLKPGVNMHSP